MDFLSGDLVSQRGQIYKCLEHNWNEVLLVRCRNQRTVPLGVDGEVACVALALTSGGSKLCNVSFFICKMGVMFT